jgi:hypothetical protein
MKTTRFSTEQQQRFEKVCNLARTARNLTLTLAEPHQNPYRDLSPSRLAHAEESVKRAFVNAIPEGSVPVLISADDKISAAISFDFAERRKSRGSVLRLVVTDKRWFEENWNLFAGDYGFGARRSLFVFLKLDEERLFSLIAPWWDPDVWLNPHIASSRAMLKEVENQIEPGTIVFSLALVRLRSCQLYFHSHDVDFVTKHVCAAAQKTKWWK